MSLGKPPAKKAPWPPLPSNDKFYRYPLPYPVGKKKGENFATVAKDHALEPADLIRYNFLTTNPDAVNWYLGNYVGCPELRSGVRNYSFEGAVQDEKKRTGMIFVPMFGEQVSDYVNRLGGKVVENYNRSDKKEPGGSCFRVCHARVREAGRQVGVTVPELHERGAADPGTFSLLWGSHIGHTEEWKKLPLEYRGKGAAGAMAWAGLGELVDSAGIWAGKLKPGAVLQGWVVASDYERVRDGKEPTNLGHSFIFLNYARKGSAVTGLVIADQGYQSDEPLVKGDYGYLVGANLVTKGRP